MTREIGPCAQSEIDLSRVHRDHLADTIKGDLSVCAWRWTLAEAVSSSQRWEAPHASGQCKAEIRFYEPDGININADCGSTHLGKLKRARALGQFLTSA